MKVYLFLFLDLQVSGVEQMPVDDRSEGREKTMLKSCKFYYWCIKKRDGLMDGWMNEGRKDEMDGWMDE